jgi:capsule biosynthesis phosphatase
MRICIDMDGTICEIRKPDELYIDVLPKQGAIEALKKLKAEGHYIIIHTSRHMKACNNNIGEIIAKQAPVFHEWFKKWGIEYDELLFGKPLADVYIDDRGLQFENWKDINI